MSILGVTTNKYWDDLDRELRTSVEESFGIESPTIASTVTETYRGHEESPRVSRTRRLGRKWPLLLAIVAIASVLSCMMSTERPLDLVVPVLVVAVSAAASLRRNRDRSLRLVWLLGSCALASAGLARAIVEPAAGIAGLIFALCGGAILAWPALLAVVIRTESRVRVAQVARLRVEDDDALAPPTSCRPSQPAHESDRDRAR